MTKRPRSKTSKALIDADYTLKEGRAWLEVGPFAIRIAKTDEGVAVDIYPNSREDESSIASCYAFDTEAEEVSQ